jgi:hypothetical protein
LGAIDSVSEELQEMNEEIKDKASPKEKKPNEAIETYCGCARYNFPSHECTGWHQRTNPSRFRT